MEKGLLSVVITTYKRHFDIIEEAIISVLEQTYKPIEILIVDDNCTDSPYSEEIISGLEKYPQIRYIKMTENSGACAARNEGILEARGEYVGFLDDDDLWLPEKAEKQLALFENRKVMMVFCRGLLFYDNDRDNATPYYTSNDFYNQPSFGDLIKIDRIGSTSQAIIRREGFSLFGLFDPRLPARQDYEMWLRITSHGYIALGVDEPLFMHRLHAGEQITKIPKRALDANLYVYNRYRPEFRKERGGRFIIFTTISGHYRECGKYFLGMWWLLRAFMLRPIRFFALLAKRNSK